jgi:hypothetical protein
VSLSIRSFFLDADGILLHTSRAQLSAMFKRPHAHPIARFAGQQVRCAEAVVELAPRAPVRVRSLNCYLLRFDSQGVLDWDDLAALVAARSTGGLAASGEQKEPSHMPFLHWQPTPEQQAAICDAALGHAQAHWI